MLLDPGYWSKSAFPNSYFNNHYWPRFGSCPSFPEGVMVRLSDELWQLPGYYNLIVLTDDQAVLKLI